MSENYSKDKQKCIAANTAYENGDFDKAMAILNNNDIAALPCALHNKGYFCYIDNYTDTDESDSTEYAKKLLADSLRISNSNPKTHLLLGKIYFEEQNYELSAKEFKKALTESEGINLSSLNNLGVALHFLNRSKESENCYKKALEFEHNPISAYNLAIEYALSHNNDCERFISQISPCDDVDNTDLARLYYLIGNYESVCNSIAPIWNSMVPDVLNYGIYSYSLKKLGLTDKYNTVKNEAPKLIKDYINDFEDEAAINAYTNLLNDLKTIDKQIEQNHKPAISPKPKLIDCCYLNYCVVHNNKHWINFS